jgi:hypothetical protein
MTMLSFENFQINGNYFIEEPYEEIEEDEQISVIEEEETSTTNNDFSDEELDNYENLFEGNLLDDMLD